MQVSGGWGMGGRVQAGRVRWGSQDRAKAWEQGILGASGGADRSLDALPLSLYQPGLLEQCLILPQVLGPQFLHGPDSSGPQSMRSSATEPKYWGRTSQEW